MGSIQTLQVFEFGSQEPSSGCAAISEVGRLIGTTWLRNGSACLLSTVDTGPWSFSKCW